jgi:capsular polysaccharide biosynthesis protein
MTASRPIAGAIIRVPQKLHFGYVAAGVFDAERRALPIAPLFTSTDSVFPVARPPVAAPSATISGTCLWGGVAFDAFGHWLTETFPYLARMQPLLAAHPEAEVLMIRRIGPAPLAWGALHRSFADRIGLDLSRIRVVMQDTRVERLILPPDPFGRANHYTPDTIASLDAAGFAPAAGNGRSLFLSRRRLSAGNDRTPNIAEVEAEFAAQGYDILYPEQLTLDEQLKQIVGARHIAGENGSALHWALYSPHIRSVISLGWKLKLQAGICAARGQTCLTGRRPLIGPLLGRRQSVPLNVIRRAIAAAKDA